MAKIAFVVGDEFEDTELRVPFDAVKKAGHEAVIIGVEQGKQLEGKQHKEKISVDCAAADANPAEYDALVIPGGASPDHLRIEPKVVQFAKQMMDAGKPIAAICHGPQLLLEADSKALAGKQMTSWPSVRNELTLAGATWVDREVAVDGQFITSRNPHDAPAFARSLLSSLETSAPARAAR